MELLTIIYAVLAATLGLSGGETRLTAASAMVAVDQSASVAADPCAKAERALPGMAMLGSGFAPRTVPQARIPAISAKPRLGGSILSLFGQRRE